MHRDVPADSLADLVREPKEDIEVFASLPRREGLGDAFERLPETLLGLLPSEVPTRF
jgi:hypothetical protein